MVDSVLFIEQYSLSSNHLDAFAVIDLSLKKSPLDQRGSSLLTMILPALTTSWLGSTKKGLTMRDFLLPTSSEQYIRYTGDTGVRAETVVSNTNDIRKL